MILSKGTAKDLPLLVGEVPTSTGHRIETFIEVLRETHKGNDQAVVSVIDAFDQAAARVKVIPSRTARMEIKCLDGKQVTLTDVEQMLAVEMLDCLIQDRLVASITVHIEPDT